MTGLMVVIVILLIVMLLWMVVVTMMYYALVRALKSIKEYTDTAVAQQDGLTRDVLKAFNAVVDLCHTLDDEIDDCKEKTERMYEETEADKQFALNTIKETRRLQSAIMAKMGVVEDEQTIADTSEV